MAQQELDRLSGVCSELQVSLERANADTEMNAEQDRARVAELEAELEKVEAKREAERKENKKLNKEIMALKVREKDLQAQQHETLKRIGQLEAETAQAALQS